MGGCIFYCLFSWLTVIFVWDTWWFFFTFVFGSICCKKVYKGVVYMLFERDRILNLNSRPSFILPREYSLLSWWSYLSELNIGNFLSDCPTFIWYILVSLILRYWEVVSCESLTIIIVVLCVFSEDSVADPCLYICQEFGHKLSVSLVFRSYLFEGIFSILHSWIYFCCVTPLQALPIGYLHFRSSTSGLHNRELTSDLLFLLFQLSILESGLCQGV